MQQIAFTKSHRATQLGPYCLGPYKPRTGLTPRCYVPGIFAEESEATVKSLVLIGNNGAMHFSGNPEPYDCDVPLMLFAPNTRRVFR